MSADTHIVISRHGEQRCRERVGIPRRAVRRAVTTAWQRGAVSMRSQSTGLVAKAYGGHAYLFQTDGASVTFVTVLHEKIIDEAREGFRNVARHFELTSRKRRRAEASRRAQRNEERTAP